MKRWLYADCGRGRKRKVRLEAAVAILDRLAKVEMREGILGNRNEKEMTFEQIL